MSLITVVVVLIVIGILLWLVESYLPIPANIKRIIEIVVVVGIVLWLLQIFGLLSMVDAIKIGK